MTLLETPLLFGWETCSTCNGPSPECTPGSNCYFDVFTPKRFGYLTLYQRSRAEPVAGGRARDPVPPGHGRVRRLRVQRRRGRRAAGHRGAQRARVHDGRELRGRQRGLGRLLDPLAGGAQQGLPPRADRRPRLALQQLRPGHPQPHRVPAAQRRRAGAHQDGAAAGAPGAPLLRDRGLERAARVRHLATAASWATSTPRRAPSRCGRPSTTPTARPCRASSSGAARSAAASSRRPSARRTTSPAIRSPRTSRPGPTTTSCAPCRPTATTCGPRPSGSPTAEAVAGRT